MTTGVAKIVKTAIGGATTDVSVLTAFGGEEVFVQTKKMDFGNADVEKILSAILVEITGRGLIDDINLYIGLSQRYNDTSVWYGPYSLAAADSLTWVRIPNSRYIELKIVDSLPMTQWKLSEIIFYGRLLKQTMQGMVGPRGRR